MEETLNHIMQRILAAREPYKPNHSKKAQHMRRRKAVRHAFNRKRRRIESHRNR